MTKIGLMGCGTVAQYGHLPAILATPGLQLQAVYDPFPGSLQAGREKFGIAELYSDVEAFFRSGIEAISITSPAPVHRDNVLGAAAHRLPVLCEKPLAMTRAEGEEMIAAMRAAGCSLYTAFCYRFSPSALAIRELVQSGAIGQVRSLRLIYNWNCHGKYETAPDGRRRIQKRREDRMFEGGPMVDCGTHQIDLAHFWLGSPVVSYAGHGAWVDEYEAPDHVWLHLLHANGAHTMVEMSYSYHHTSKNRRAEFVYELIGTEGVIRYDREAHSFALENGQGRRELEFHHEKSFEGLYAEWAKALVCGRSELLTSAEDGLRSVELSREATEDVVRRRPRNLA